MAVLLFPFRHLRAVPKSDLLIGAAIVALGMLEAFTVATEYGTTGMTKLWWVGQALVTGVLVWFRRRSPVAVFILMILAQYAWHRQGYEHCQTWQLAALLIVFHTVGAELPFRPGLTCAVSGILVFGSGAVDHRRLPLEEAIFLTVLFGAAYLTGLALRAYVVRVHHLAEQAVHLERDREREAAEAVARERARIARELHDVVAHSVSMMVMRAGALRRSRGGDDETLLGIERMGREAVEELRVMLGVLRMPLNENIPQPGLDLLSGTVDSLVSSGLRVTLDVRGEAVRLAPGLDLSVYRIAQEALTNAVKHAGESEIRITLSYHRDFVEVEVTNGRGNGGRFSALSTGNGLIGMRERAALFGGTFEAGPRPEGGFRVHASLPTSLEVSAGEPIA
ncbi:sensor histidine kinase [Streptosporangium amethystogenes]|uniref:sensor histidine kinase n=1 Tax=Streptosporangium amethystogenes TaxID=2002 RepID=UPI0006914D27|nr:histidine kinase [Streptosporangium amethystogenes]